MIAGEIGEIRQFIGTFTRAYRVIEAAIYDAAGVPFCFLTWQQWHGRCSISLLFLRASMKNCLNVLSN